MVDYIFRFAVEHKSPEPIKHYAVRADIKSEGEIWLLPAGEAPSAGYWKRLAQVDWHQLFYCPGAVGIPFFLEFKRKCQGKHTVDRLNP